MSDYSSVISVDLFGMFTLSTGACQTNCQSRVSWRHHNELFNTAAVFQSISIYFNTILPWRLLLLISQNGLQILSSRNKAVGKCTPGWLWRFPAQWLDSNVAGLQRVQLGEKQPVAFYWRIHCSLKSEGFENLWVQRLQEIFCFLKRITSGGESLPLVQ